MDNSTALACGMSQITNYYMRQKLKNNSLNVCKQF